MTKFSHNLPSRVTQKDIADAVGVSHVTVSQVLHGSRRSRVSAKMQEEIMRVAAQMGYEPRDVTTHNINFVVTQDSLWWQMTTGILAHADSVLREHGYHLSMSTLDATNIEDAPVLLNRKRMDGVIFTEWFAEAEAFYEALSIPWVVMSDTDETEIPPFVHQVRTDTVGTARRLTAHLLAAGHQRICVMTGQAGVGSHVRLERGVRAGMEAAGLPQDSVSIIRRDPTLELEDAVLPLMQSKRPPTAIVVGSPGNALLLMNRLQSNGYRVPADVSVVSMVDSPQLRALKPALTATTLLGYDNALTAVEKVLQLIKRPQLPPEQQLYTGEIIERDSVSRPSQ